MEKRTDNKGRKLKEGESQRKDGMYQFRYTDREGNRRTLYSWKLTTQDKVPTGKGDGKCLRELELEIGKESPLKRQSSEKTVLQYTEEFLDKRIDYAMNTRVGYETDLRAYLKESCLSNMLITKVSKSDILEFYSYLSKERKLGFSAIKRNHSLLNSVFQVAIKDGIIVQNPCDKCLLEYRNGCSHNRFSLSIQEQHVLLEYLKDSSNYYSKHYETVAVLLGTGLRVSEFIGLTWDEIDLCPLGK